MDANAGIPASLTTVTGDPPVSEAQRRAMFAAKEGRSTLGIPKSVGEKFVGQGHDEKDDATRGAGVALRDPDGRLLFMRRQGGDAAGTWAFPGGFAHHNESEEAAAIRELGEEIGLLLTRPLRVTLDSVNGVAADDLKYTTFLHDVDEPFQPQLNNEHSGYVWAAPDEAPQPLHPGVEKTLSKMGKDMIGEDTALMIAFDQGSVRSYDKDGRLHVATSPISKANVCPYVGKEIPNWQGLGLDPGRVYKLLRHPDELAKAASTFDGIPILLKHKPMNAETHDPGVVVGATGTETKFKHPYLSNSLTVWPEHAIEAIGSDEQKELSSAYHYRADMTPGTYQGESYDGIMRDIHGNHVAIVKEGRAGPDVVVGDSKETINNHEQETIMKTEADGAPKSDPKADPKIEPKVEPKLAKDAIEDLKKGGPPDPQGNPPVQPPKPGAAAAPAGEEDPGKNRNEGIRAFLRDKISADNMRALDALLAGGSSEALAKPEHPSGETLITGEPEKDPMKAMDEQIEKAIKVATDAATKVQKDIREAERAVRPWVGELAVAQDSAEAVYHTALEALGVKDVKEVKEVAALKAILNVQPKPGSKKDPVPAMAQDAAAIDSFNKRFPGAARIGNL